MLKHLIFDFDCLIITRQTLGLSELFSFDENRRLGYPRLLIMIKHAFCHFLDISTETQVLPVQQRRYICKNV